MAFSDGLSRFKQSGMHYVICDRCGGKFRFKDCTLTTFALPGPMTLLVCNEGCNDVLYLGSLPPRIRPEKTVPASNIRSELEPTDTGIFQTGHTTQIPPYNPATSPTEPK